MFLFGEEVGAENRFKYGAVFKNREDIKQLRSTTGAELFRFYSELNRLRSDWPAVRSRNIDVIYTHNGNRILASGQNSASELTGMLTNVRIRMVFSSN